MNKEKMQDIKERLDLFPSNMNKPAQKAYCELFDYIANLEQQCKKQKEVIDKAIEYINNLECLHIGIGENEYNLDKMYGSTKNYVRDLLEILKGSDK